jgi:prolyl-tRNA synthetase
MRLSKAFVPTLKEVPADAVIVSHKLMIRSGMIRPLTAGVYSFLPLGYKVIKKIIEIVREEMDSIGGQEFLLPALNPIELWEQTDRVKAFGDTMYHIKNRPYVLAPTHEEVITQIAKNHIQSYKDMPQVWYQVQTKFRNEARPRSGVIRSRQFFMKDAYSLDSSWEGLDKSYDDQHDAYHRIFKRCGIKFFTVGASSGAMGGSKSQEFMVESNAGEDTCAICDKCNYAANVEVASSSKEKIGKREESKLIEKIHTPNIKTIDELCTFLKIKPEDCAKAVVYHYQAPEDKWEPVLVFMSGNDELNESKLQAALGAQVTPAKPEDLFNIFGANAGSLGPINIMKKIKIIADKRLEGANNLYSGANEDDYHVSGVDFDRDVKLDGFFDLRTINEGEGCPNCGTPLRVVKAIELGHIFKLGTKYSVGLQANFLDESGAEKPIIMGSYGIGVERVAACYIEQNNDNFGIIWNKELAPYLISLIAVNTNVESVVVKAEEIYKALTAKKIETLYDDRVGLSPGFKFKDADLIGAPIQVLVGEKNMKNGKIEIKIRKTNERHLVDIDTALESIEKILSEIE